MPRTPDEEVPASFPSSGIHQVFKRIDLLSARAAIRCPAVICKFRKYVPVLQRSRPSCSSTAQRQEHCATPRESPARRGHDKVVFKEQFTIRDSTPAAPVKQQLNHPVRRSPRPRLESRQHVVMIQQQINRDTIQLRVIFHRQRLFLVSVRGRHVSSGVSI